MWNEIDHLKYQELPPNYPTKGVKNTKMYHNKHGLLNLLKVKIIPYSSPNKIQKFQLKGAL